MNKFLQQIKNKFILVIIIVAVIFGLAGGLTASLLTRAYILDSYYNIPFFGEINFSNLSGQKGLIISDAKKVVVEQDAKVGEIIGAAENSLVGVFKKIVASGATNDQKTDVSDFYRLDQPIGQGTIITSDGWIITSWQPEPASQSNKDNKIDLSDYVIITKDRKIYPIDKMVNDDLTAFNFLHVPASDLPVIKFAEQQDITNGSIVLAVDWLGRSFLTSIEGENKISNNPVISTENFSTDLLTADNPAAQFKGTPLLNLSGDILAMIDNQAKITPITQLTGAINSLLKYKEIRRASLGVFYLDLSGLVANSGVSDSNMDQGALIYKNPFGVAVVKGSSAEKAGLKEGDIITSINNQTLDQADNLTDVLQKYVAGDKVKVLFKRAGVEQTVDVTLDQIK